MKNDDKICQSCCLPLDKEEMLGTKANGEKCEDYCCYCYKNGVFTRPDTTLETMLEISAKVWADKDPNITIEEAKVQLKKKMPTLKRWSE
jgi:hypothetical protein